MSMPNLGANALALAKAAAFGTCEFCERSGLAILPVRPAIMRRDSGAPQLPLALQPTDGNGGKRLPLHGQAAQYTGRILRSGYLYVYDERGTWDKYWITTHGYFMKVPVGVPLDPAYTVGREPCDKSGHKEIAACITVPNPTQAQRIWIAFSNVEWTLRVLQLHQDESYRQRHMRVFDVKAWMQSNQAPHAQTLETVASVVAEYAPQTRGETFAFSIHEFGSRASTRDRLVQAAAALGPAPGALLMLDDPVGVASDIAACLAELRHGFMSKEDRERKLSLSTAIMGLQEIMAENAQYEAFDIRDQLERDAMLMPDGVGRMMINPYPATVPEVSPSELQTAADESWKKYRTDYNEDARASWHREYLLEHQAYLDQTLIPLAMTHVAWMRSRQMFEYFDCSYDDASVDIGLVYTRMFTMCLQDTQQFEPCAKLYYDWISGSYSDPYNLLLRGIVLNLKKARDQLAREIQAPVTWTTIGWDNLCAGFSALAGDALKDKADVLTQFVLATGGAITKLLQTAAEGPARQSLVALGMVAQRPVVPVHLTGSFKTFRASLIRQLLKTSGIKGLSENALQREVTLALRRLAVRGEPMNSVVSVRLLVMIDEETLKGMQKGLSKSEQARWVASSLRTAEQIEALNLSAWKERIHHDLPAATASAGARVAKAVPFVGNLIAGYVQIAAGISFYREFETAKWEKGSRLVGAVSLFAATLADTAERVLKALGNSRLVAGQAAYGEIWMIRAAGAAKVFGVVGAAIGVVWDAYEAGHNAFQGNTRLAVAYGLSALAGIEIAVAVALALVWLAIAAAVLYLFAQIGIARFGDDKLDTWLQRCVWGRDTANRYTTSETEMNALRAAMGGLR